jgi:hypothetical protein
MYLVPSQMSGVQASLWLVAANDLPAMAAEGLKAWLSCKVKVQWY